MVENLQCFVNAVSIDIVSNLVFWSRLANKLEPGQIVQHYATITKHSNLNSIDRLQFPWLTASTMAIAQITGL